MASQPQEFNVDTRKTSLKAWHALSSEDERITFIAFLDSRNQTNRSEIFLEL
jgi:hypothetical protein